MKSFAEYRELEEAVKIGTKVKIHAPGKDYHGEVGHVGEIRHGAYKGAPKTYTVDCGDRKSIQLDKKEVKVHKEEVDQLEEMTQGKEYTQAQLQKKIQSGNWEATHDIKPGKHAEMRHHSGKRVTVRVKEEVDSTVEDLTEGTQSSIEKKIQAKRDSMSLAKEQRRAKGQHVQGQREIKLQAEIDRLNTELSQLKRQGMSEESELGDLAHWMANMKSGKAKMKEETITESADAMAAYVAAVQRDVDRTKPHDQRPVTEAAPVANHQNEYVATIDKYVGSHLHKQG